MVAMDSRDKCGECGAAIPADSPRGFCAECLLGLGLNQMQKAEGRVQNEVGEQGEAGDGNGGQETGLQQAPKKAKPLQQTAASLTDEPGDRIGRYHLLEEIGHGGCGVVYLAEQDEP